jgi:hypothetical protein
MSFLELYLLAAAGVAISVALPILRRMLPTAKPAGLQGLWKPAKPYVIVGAFSLLTALLIVAFLGGTVEDWRAVLLAGYAWDSTLQKVAT